MKLNNSSKAFQAGIWYTVSNILLRAVSVLTAPIFTRLLTPADYGKFNNFFSWQTVLACVFGLCLSYSIGRAKIDYKDDFYGFISSIQTLAILTGCTMLCLCLPFLDVISSFVEIDKALLIALMVMLIVSPSIEYLQSKFRFEYKYTQNITIAILNTVSVVVISIGLILLSELDKRYIARIMGSVIPVFCIGVYAVFYLYFKGKRFINLDYWKYALRISLPMIPHGLAMVLLAQIDRIMLIKMDGDIAAGLYSFGYSYALIISVFTNAIMNAWQPWLYEKVSEGQYEEIIKSNRQINVLAFFMTISFIIIGPEVIMILGSAPFYESKWMVAPIIAGCLFQFIYGYFSLMEIYCKKTKYIAYGSVGAAIIKIVLNYFFIPKFGYIGCAYTSMIGYGLLLFYHWLAFKYVFKYQIFAEHQLARIVIMTTVLTFLLVFTYYTVVIRYVIMALFCVTTGYYYRDLIKPYLMKYIVIRK